MFKSFPPNVKKIFVNTGNILTLNEVKIKAGQNPTDELIESLKITLSNWQLPSIGGDDDTLQVRRIEDDMGLRINVDERKGLKVSIKIFISTLEKEALEEALNSVFAALNTNCIDSLVLAYVCKTENNDEVLSGLKELWLILEEFVKSENLVSIGVSDVDTEVFIDLYNWAKVKPSIVQINLASCCVVPPALQEFTKQKDVQLLTHSDPFEILPKNALNEVFESSRLEKHVFILHWALRFQVHVKCRGVLSSKGYLLCVLRVPFE